VTGVSSLQRPPISPSCRRRSTGSSYSDYAPRARARIDPALIPHEVEKRGVTTQTNPRTEAPRQSRFGPAPQVTELTRVTLSRWRHGFEPRWDYQGRRLRTRRLIRRISTSSSWWASVQPCSRERRDRSRRRANARSTCRHHRFVGGIGVGGEGFRPMPAETVSRCS
jgi:hypothetical protein